MRALILEADSEMIEERKWKKPSNAMAGVPVWSHNGIVCTGETYTKVVKLNGPPTPDERWLCRGSPNDQTQGRQADVPRRRPRGRSFLSLLKNSRYEQAATIV